MTGSAAAQGTERMVQMPLDQAKKQGRVSADSFRKLTSLLKKLETLPPVIPVPIVLETAEAITLESDVAAAVAPEVVIQAQEEVPPQEIPAIKAETEFLPEPAVLEPAPLPTEDQPAAPEMAVSEFALPVDVPAAAPEMKVPELPLSDPALEPKAETVPEVVGEAFIANVQESFQSFAEPLLETQITTLRKSRLAKARITQPPPLPPADIQPQSRTEATVGLQTPEQEAEAAELARSLLDMMAQGSAAGQPQERALAADTLLRMLPRLPLKSRVMLASRLCMMEQPHHSLVAKLITDHDISVSGPLLEDCAQLSDEDLLRVLAEQDSNKRRMMARRRKISRTVTTALIETDDPSVLLTIARNAGAEITPEGFAMMERAAGHRHELLAPMCIRADLPVHFAFNLFWLAPPELRRYLLTRFLTDSETLTKILKIARGAQGDDANPKAPIDPQLVAISLAKAVNGDISTAAEALAEMSSLAPDTITRILEDRQGEPLMALLKTLGFPRSQVQEQVEALKDAIIEPTRSAEELQSLFDSLSFNKARILLTYWDWSSLGTGPYAHVQ